MPEDDFGDPPCRSPRFRAVEFRESRLLGRGAFGEVFLVKAVPIGATGAAAAFALKRSSVALISDTGLERAKDEARLLQRLGKEHDCILRCFDFRVTGGPVLELLLEFAPLGDLCGRLKARSEGLPEAEVAAFASDVASGLAHIHTLAPKVLHRDVKPANVVLFPVRDGVPRAKLADFGIAKILEVDGSFAGAATVIGTPHYFSPEICRGEKYDERSDAWALGCVIYEMMCLRRPFHQSDGNIAILALRVMEGRYDKELLMQQAARYSGVVVLLLLGLLTPEAAQRSRASDVAEPLRKLRCEVGGALRRALPWWCSLAALEPEPSEPELTRSPCTDSWAGAEQVFSRPETPVTLLPEATLPASALEAALLSKNLFASSKFERTAELKSHLEGARCASPADPPTLMPQASGLGPPTGREARRTPTDPAAFSPAAGFGEREDGLGDTLRFDGSTMESPYAEQLDASLGTCAGQDPGLPSRLAWMGYSDTDVTRGSDTAFGRAPSPPESRCGDAVPEASPGAPGPDETLRWAGARIFLRPLWRPGGSGDGPVLFCFASEAEGPPPPQPAGEAERQRREAAEGWFEVELTIDSPRAFREKAEASKASAGIFSLTAVD